MNTVPYGELTATTELKHQTGSQVTFVTEIMVCSVNLPFLLALM